jgi:cation transport ATPase
MSEARAPGSAAPSSAAFCPACGKPIDPLRAGQVAILEGRFAYFCDRECKQGFMSGRRSGLQDAATAEPPPVRSGERSIEPTPEPAAAAFPAPTPSSLPPVAPASRPPPVSAAAPAVEPATPAPRTTSEPPPATLRSPAVAQDEPAQPASAAPAAPRAATARALERPGARAYTSLALAGVAAGVCSPAFALLGVGLTPRVLLAAAATAALVARVVLRGAQPGDPHPLACVGPSVAAAVLAAWRASAGDSRAAPLAALAGLGAAAALGIELVLDRARDQLEQSRKRLARALDVETRVQRGQDTVLVAAADVRPGEKVSIEAGQTIGVDGMVVSGEAVVVPWADAAVETKKGEGDAVVAGARVVSGRLRVNTTWSGADRAFLKMVSAPATRIESAAPMSRAARVALERAAPVAALVGGAAAWAGNVGWTDLAAVACGAAMAALGGGVASVVALCHARAQMQGLSHGIVYKDPTAFDRAGHVEIAVLCSRGTVLMGEPEIVSLEALGACDEEHLLALAAGAETASTHPFAAAVLRAARTRGVTPDTVRSANVHAGLGVTALASSGERIVVGGRALLLQEKVSVAIADARVTELEAQGRSVLLVAAGDKLIGLIALQDGLRPGARGAVQRLLDSRIEPVLLSGEARETCETIGRALEIDHIRPEVLPGDRGAEVRSLREGGRVVAVIGHPAGDDGALGGADVSVAMSSAGAAPGEWSISLATDDVRDGALALSIALDTRARAKRALVAGLVPCAVALLTIVFGVASPLVAPAAALLGTLLAASRLRE